tara:strand:- start:80 stop:247 length:168 start_codon:yes stop_codon:yes gene_type:complete
MERYAASIVKSVALLIIFDPFLATTVSVKLPTVIRTLCPIAGEAGSVIVLVAALT